MHFLLFFLSVFSFVGSDLPKAPAPNKSVVNNLAVNKMMLLQLVNNVRQSGCRCGDTYYPPAKPLTWNDQLEQAAFGHSNAMITKKFFAHTAPDGSTGGSRIEQAGYKWKSFGENIAFGYRSEKEVIEGWIKSPGHCKNIMNRDFKEMGVARAGNYWTQTFGSK